MGYPTEKNIGNAFAISDIRIVGPRPIDLQVLAFEAATKTLKWMTISGVGGGAPVTASYVTLGLHADLTAERVLTGTVNQIILTDTGANGTITLSTPQNIHTGASPTFVGMTLTGLPTGIVKSIAGVLTSVTLSTTDVNEGTNLYFTEDRVHLTEDPLIYALMGA